MESRTERWRPENTASRKVPSNRQSVERSVMNSFPPTFTRTISPLASPLSVASVAAVSIRFCLLSFRLVRLLPSPLPDDGTPTSPPLSPVPHACRHVGTTAGEYATGCGGGARASDRAAVAGEGEADSAPAPPADGNGAEVKNEAARGMRSDAAASSTNVEEDAVAVVADGPLARSERRRAFTSRSSCASTPPPPPPPPTTGWAEVFRW